MLHKNSLFIGFFLLIMSTSNTLTAQQNNNPWQDIVENELMKNNSERQIIPEVYRTVTLDQISLTDILKEAPIKHSSEAATTEVVLTLPLPNGTDETFRIVNAPIMADELAAEYPEIQSFAGQGLDDPTAYVRFGVTQKGFHAMILSAKHSTVFIDAYAKNDSEHYVSYYKTDYAKRIDDNFSCLTEGETKQEAAKKAIGSNLFKAGGDCQLRTYRLALACTREYATFHGGTTASVLAEYNVAMTRVNGIYETDFAVTMELINNTDDLIFLSEPDPYTNNSGGAMLGQNQTTCDNVIGSANYDIGHVFSTGGGGIAGLGVPCINNQKARGVTGLGSPVNDPFYVDYVAHEIGHQFGANHTFNNSCGGNRNNNTAVEPGSASTIMGYAGICAPNVQNNSDPYFHAISLIEVYNYITLQEGSQCPVVTNNPNNPPVVTMPSTSFTIPAQTPFFLTAEATDPDGGALTYCWEQMNNEISPQSPQASNTGGPNFRSLDPTDSPTRYFPSIDNIINETTDTWEVLSDVTRNMDFRCVVRDNNMGEGCTDEVDVSINVNDTAGPFLVTNPNTNLTWTVGANAPVTWDVANTDQSPVSCANVDIMLSTDGGNTYPITLATNVPNSGSTMVTVPNNLTNTARVMVFCSGNIFFDISNSNFTIQEPVEPTFLVSANPTSVVACNDATATYNLDFSALAGFNESINLSATGLPSGATATFSNNPVSASGNSTLTVSNLNGASAGDYSITVEANSPSVSNTVPLTLSLAAGIPQVQSLTMPADNSGGVSIFAGLAWEAVSGATNYNVVVASNPDFSAGSIVFNGNTAENNIITSSLDEETVYYWQVQATTACGTGGFSAYNAFQTASVTCQTYSSSDVPINIPSTAAGEITSELVIGDEVFSDVDVNVFIRHTWTGDLTATLTSPTGLAVELFNQPGFPASDFGCSGDDINVTLDDAAINDASVLEGTCGNSTPSISGIFQPTESLSLFNGADAQGTWTLTVADAFGEDGGQLDSWSIVGCSASTAQPAAPIFSSDDLNLAQGATATVANANLNASAANNTDLQLVYTVLTLPANGTLTLNGSAVTIGSTFTQADINAGFLSYTHDASATATDSFTFSIQTAQNGWLAEGILNINILQNNLSATAEVQTQIACNGDTNGSIEASPTGGNPPLSYSIDGENFQTSPTFSGLASGTYTITVKDNFGFEVSTNMVTLDNPTAITSDNDITGNTITVTASGGTGTLTYSIDDTNYQASNIFADLANGTYNVCVKDANDCVVCKMETIAVNNVSVTATATQLISCFNGNDGTITVNAAGGSEPYLYSINGSNPQFSNVFSLLTSDTYNITATDNDGFSATTSVTLNNPTQIISNVSTDGSTITVFASGGTGNLMYSIDDVNFQMSNEFTGVANGTYNVCTRDANDCEVCSVAVIAVDMVIVSANLTNDISCNNANDAVITVSAAGGEPPYSYSLNGGTAQSSNIFSDLEANTYTVEVIDNAGTSLQTNQVTVTNPTLISVSSSVTDATITVAASGGTGTLSYTIDGSNYQASNVFNNTPNGTYQVCARDANECEECTSATVAVNNLVVSATVSTPISCFDAADAIITVSAAGGSEPYSYSLNGTGTPQDSNVFTGVGPGEFFVQVTDNDGFVLNSNPITLTNPNQITLTADVNEFTVTLNAAGGTNDFQYSSNGTDYINSNVFVLDQNGSYTFFVLDSNGCEETVTVTVGVNQIFAIANVQNLPSCAGGTDACIAVSVTGATPPVQFEVNGTVQQNDGVFCGLTADTYVVNITDADGFQFTTDPVTISEPDAIVIQPTVLCGVISVEASGGTGDLTITLDGAVIDGETPVENGTYDVVVLDANGCTQSQEIVVSSIVSADISAEPIPCFGGLGAIIINNEVGGAEPYAYSINGINFQNSNIFSDLPPADYEITVQDAQGCFIVLEETITGNEAITIEATSVGSTLTIDAVGGVGNFEYSIDGENFQDSNIFADLPPGEYTVTVLDSNGCTETTIAEILTNINDLAGALEFAINPNPNTGVFNLLINMPTERDLIVRIFDVAGKEVFRNIYLKNNDFFSQNIRTQNLAAGSYFVTVHDGKMTGTKEVVVIE